ncbi:MAG TPA: hypothetical protein VMF08_02055 [Candidatus Sulfotelmatobacter sp.]|nr:hypothetical protein [Candidatus Sulfotelmatobacter sp.]
MKGIRPGCFVVLLLSLWLADSCSQRPPETRISREKWDKDTTSGAYDTVGNHDPKWDKDARDALDAYAQTSTAPDDEQETLSDLIGDAADNAVAAGCQDPLIRYLYVRLLARGPVEIASGPPESLPKRRRPTGEQFVSGHSQILCKCGYRRNPLVEPGQ